MPRLSGHRDPISRGIASRSATRDRYALFTTAFTTNSAQRRFNDRIGSNEQESRELYCRLFGGAVTVDPTATSTRGSLHTARESKGQAVCNLVAGSYNAHLASLAELKDRSSVVAALAPSRLAKVLRDGVSSALDQYGPQLQPGTSALIANWLHQHVQLVERLTQPWNALSAGSASDVVRGFKAG